MRVSTALGRFGEDTAAAHLQASGWTLLDRNWRCSAGEIDIIATDGAVLVFVEVKTRSSRAFGDPAEAVGPVKARRLRVLAATWLQEHRAEAPQSGWREVRFDVVSVLRGPDGLVIDRVAGAF